VKRKRSEYEHYQANNPLTQHYITTGAILPEKKEQPKVVKRKRNIKVLLRSKKSR
jgi:hypothetical protein|tara:strand:- start:174 stop:338 length:165 start_codon:yes stop_codon:yes gene_type:complete